jgi:hypothetical protein
MNGVNSELAKALTGQKTSWGKTLQGEGTSLVSSGLKMGEGALAKAFGLGGKRGDSIMNPLFVQDVGGGYSSAANTVGESGALGSLGKLISMFPIPHFALGGYTPGGMALTGEEGPEVATYPAGTHITSNRDLRKMLGGGGGGVSYSIGNIDASGSNPAEVEMRFQRALQQVHTQAVQSSAKAQREMAARRPRSS